MSHGIEEAESKMYFDYSVKMECAQVMRRVEYPQQAPSSFIYSYSPHSHTRSSCSATKSCFQYTPDWLVLCSFDVDRNDVRDMRHECMTFQAL